MEYKKILEGTIRGGEKLSEEKLERKTNHERLLILRNKGLQKGRWVRGWGNRVMGTKEGTRCGEH